MKKLLLVLVICALFAAPVFCEKPDWKNGPDVVQPGDFLLNGVFNLGHVRDVYAWYGYGAVSRTGFGGSVSLDYALPWFGLTVGGEVGFMGASYKWWWGKASYFGMPIYARVGYHPNFHIKKLDLFAMLKLGSGIGMRRWSGFSSGYYQDDFTSAGFSFGTDLGVRYFFTDKIGIYGELGWDYLWVEDVRFGRYLTVGATFKF